MKDKLIKIVPCLFVIFILITYIMIVSYADYLYLSNKVNFDNENTSLTNNDVKGAIDELYNKCNNLPAVDTNGCPEDYVCSQAQKLCKRATTLHTETCTSSSTTYYCRKDGYSQGGTITYGQLGTSGTLASGDAFDCDVNGDGIHDAAAERFYYISDYYDTSSKTFDNTYASLIYYSNSSSNGTSTTSGMDYYSSGGTGTGPLTAKYSIPGNNYWSNIELNKSIRNIYIADGSGNISSTAKSNFSYEGYAARLLTIQELYAGCYDGTTAITSSGGLSGKCKYLLENTGYSSGTERGFWLETACSSESARIVKPEYYNISCQPSKISSSSSFPRYYGVRPVIDVKKTDIDY